MSRRVMKVECAWTGRATLYKLRTYSDDRGALSVVETVTDLPFVPHRFYYLYDTGPDVERGIHGHRTLKQFMMAVTGSADVEVDDGTAKRSFRLDRPNLGLLIEPMMWRTVRNMAPGTVLAVLASENFQEADYIRDYDAFLALINGA